MEEIVFRPAESFDCPALSELVNSAYRGEVSKQGWTTEADLLGGQRTDPESLLALVTGADQVVLLALRQKLLVGCVYLRRKADRAYLGMLTVRPDLQSAGLGRRILEAAEDWAGREWGLGTIEMTVIRQRTELIAWYERRGYRVTDRIEPFPYGDARFGLPKVDDLVFAVLEKSRTLPSASAPPA